MNYLVFGGECYYASGGANDLLFICETEEEAIAKAKSSLGRRILTHIADLSDIDWDFDEGFCVEWVQVFDIKRGIFSYKSSRRCYNDVRRLGFAD